MRVIHPVWKQLLLQTLWYFTTLVGAAFGIVVAPIFSAIAHLTWESALLQSFPEWMTFWVQVRWVYVIWVAIWLIIALYIFGGMYYQLQKYASRKGVTAEKLALVKYALKKDLEEIEQMSIKEINDVYDNHRVVYEFKEEYY
jgi:hypothetical protein